MGNDASGANFKVFISYSRRDLGFVDRLQAALKARRIDAIVDRTEIEKAEDWWQRIQSLITEADTVVFALSADSLRSQICQREVDFAQSLKKRLIPIVIEGLGEAPIPDTLARLNYIFFVPHPPSDATGDFNEACEDLTRALTTDLVWIREHTRIGVLAQRWLVNGSSRDLLLRGAELSAAETWITTRPTNAPAPTDTHISFIGSSRRASTKRQWWWAGGAATVAVGASVLAGFAFLQSMEANTQRDVAARNESKALEQEKVAVAQKLEADARKAEAELQTERAEGALREARTARELTVKSINDTLLSQSNYLTDMARRSLSGDPGTALLLALEALPDKTSPAEVARERPFWEPAELALEAAIRKLQEKSVLPGHTSTITAIAVAPSQNRIITGSFDSTVRLWDATTFAHLGQLPLERGRAARIAVSPDETRVAIGSREGMVRLWDLVTLQKLGELERQNGDITSLSFTPDGSRILTTATDKSAYIWDAKTLRRVGVIAGHSETVTGIAATANGSRLITSSADNTVRVWNSNSLSQIGLIKTGKVEAFSLTPDGSRLVTVEKNGIARIWDLQTSMEVGQLKGHSGDLTSVDVSRDGTKIVTGSSDKTARVWDAKTFEQISQLGGHDGSVTVVSFMPDSTNIITGSTDRSARIWTARPFPAISALPAHRSPIYSIAVTPDSERILTSSDDKVARIWDVHTFKEIGQLAGHTDKIFKVAVAPDGKRAVTGSADRTARVWDLSSLKEIGQIRGHKAAVLGAAFSPDGSRIVTTSADTTARVWDARNFTEVGQLVPVRNLVAVDNGANVVAFTPDNKKIITGYSNWYVRVWDAKSLSERTVLTGHTGPIGSVLVSSDGKRIVTGSQDRTARIWDAETHAIIGQIKGLVNQMALTPDGRRLLTGSRNFHQPDGGNTVQVWDTETMTLLGSLEGHAGFITSIAVTPDARLVMTGSQDGAVAFWKQLPSGQPLVDEAKRLVPRCLSVVQRQAYNLVESPPQWCSGKRLFPYDLTSVALDLEKDAKRHAEIERWQDAAAALEKIIAMDDGSLASYVLTVKSDLARFHFNAAWNGFKDAILGARPLEEFLAVLPNAERGVAISSNSASLLAVRGNIYLAIGRIDDALTDMDRAISLGGRLTGNFYARGLAHERKGNRTLAIADYRTVIAQTGIDYFGNDWRDFAKAQARLRLEALAAENSGGSIKTGK